MPFSAHDRHCIVTAILPRASAGRVLDEVLAAGAPQALTLNARGTLMQESWWKSLMPAISPEQEILHLLVPNDDANALMEQIVMVGKLRLFGAGSIFAIPCRSLVCSDDFSLWQPGRYAFESKAFDIKFKTGLICLVHVTDRNAAEPIARAAIKAGAQGATITFIRGYGLRDRLGLLRITKSHDKELITVVVDEYDRDAVFEAMAIAGRVSQPGRGIVYQIPIAKGLTNLASVFQVHKHSASIQQMVRAIDELHGNTDWRAKQLRVHDPKVREFAASTRGLSRNLEQINIVAQRRDVETLLRFLLDQGVAGASVCNWRLTERDAAQTRGGMRINREFGCISLIVRPRDAETLCQQIETVMQENQMHETCHYVHEVPVVKTFASFDDEASLNDRVR